MSRLLATPELAFEARNFADSVEGVALLHLTNDLWAPGLHADDRNPELDAALEQLGWPELATDRSLAPLIAPAAERLGAALVSIATVDRLLDATPMAGDLVRHPIAGRPLARPLHSGNGPELVLYEADHLEPTTYVDALGVHRARGLRQVGTITGDRAQLRLNAWCAAQTGFLAGLARGALEIALEHVTSRQAFGRSLSALDAVQQLLGEATMRATGLQLLLGLPASASSLAYAAEAANLVCAACQQVTGAIGYTMEFPLQRRYRRASAISVWIPDWLNRLAP
ncbi:MAG: acyl-CoA dehydrogenase family protein [Solirubrobacteraceae bacterium]